MIAGMEVDLYKRLAARDGQHTVGYTERVGTGSTFRRQDGSTAAQFPRRWLRSGSETDLNDATKQEGGKGPTP